MCCCAATQASTKLEISPAEATSFTLFLLEYVRLEHGWSAARGGLQIGLNMPVVPR